MNQRFKGETLMKTGINNSKYIKSKNGINFCKSKNEN